MISNMFANGAMGYALERWQIIPWCFYVALVWVGEAWLIGRWLGLTWTVSLFRSFLANAFTGLFCAGSGICAVGLHYPLVGSQVSPVPFLDTLTMLVVWSIPSAVIEFYFWPGWAMSSRLKAFWRVIWTHIVFVPVAIGIILLSPNPYPGTYAISATWTHIHRSWFAHKLMNYVSDNSRFPDGRTPDEIIKEVVQHNHLEAYDESGNTELFNQVEFPRISITSIRTIPYEVNPAVAGKAVREDSSAESDGDQWVWYMRPKLSREQDKILWVNQFTGEARYGDLKQL